MAAELTFKANGEAALLLHEENAWHRQGTVKNLEGMTATTAALEMEADKYVMSVLPSVANVPNYGEFQIESTLNIIRHPVDGDPIPRHFGTVKPGYGMLQNMDVAAMVDILLEGTQGSWRLETAGMLREGETIFFCMKGSDFEVAGDMYGLYFGVTDQRSGKNAFDLAVTPVRYVCANTVSFGLAKAKSRITLRHHPDILQEVSWRMQVIAQAVNTGESLINALRRLEKIQIDEKRLNYILDKVFAEPSRPKTIDLLASGNEALVKRAQTADYQYKHAVEKVAEAKNRIRENFEVYASGYGANAYSAMQALTTYIDHQSGKNTDNGRRVMSERSLSDAAERTRTEYFNLLMATR